MSSTAMPALAQVINTDDEVISVKDQLDPELLALGIRAGGLVIRPGITVEEVYEDNIFRTPNNEQSDFITEVKPEIRVTTDWNLHQIELRASGDLGYYADNDSEDYEDYTAVISGRYDITYETYIDGQLRRERRHQRRDSPEDVGGDEPTVYDRNIAEVGFTRALGRVKFSTDGRYTEYDFDNTKRSGVTIDNSTRNRDEKRGSVRVGYEFTPGYEAFVSGAADRKDYDVSGVSDRSSAGYDVRVGTAVNVSGKVRGDVYVGHMARDYERGFKNIDAVNYGGEVLWNATGLTSLRAALKREIFETTGGGVSGYLRTGGKVSAEHALRRNVILEAYGGYDEDDFEGTATTREDETTRAGVAAQYRPARGVAVRLGMDYTQRESNVSSANYDNTRVMVSGNFEL